MLRKQDKENRMDIRINKDWRITTDARNFILERCRIAEDDTKVYKKGDEVWSQEAFYATLDRALSGLVKYDLLKCDAITITALKCRLQSIHDDIEAIRKELVR